MKVLILGGYGTFGGRLVQLLADLDGVELIVAGRSLAKAQAFCAAFQGAATVTPLALDRAAVPDVLADLAVEALVDATGPFQAYGDAPYSVAQACIATRTPYFDFADGADFVEGIRQFDADARAAGIPVLSGVSSFPVLTAAVLREIAQTTEVRAVFGGIAPSPHAGVGLNVMRAVLSYAGAPVSLKRGGKVTKAIGLAETRRSTISVPGELPLDMRTFSLVDVPDHRIIPAEVPGIISIWMGAGPVPGYLHRVLILLARARAALRLPPLTGLAPVCHWVLNTLAHGPHRGGMFISAEGTRDGAQITVSWHLLAEGDAGPLIPSMAVACLLRDMAAGKTPPPGARPATRDLSLADYRKLFEQHGIRDGFREKPSATNGLYQRNLATAFTRLPAPLQALHRVERKHVWAGRGTITRGRNPLAQLIARCIGFPKAGEDVPVSVTLIADGAGGERWHRNFDGVEFRSHQSVGRGANSHLIVENFGPVRVGLALVIEGESLRIIPRRWTLFALPLPRFLLPGGDTFEDVDDAGRFRFNVTIAAPLIGLIVAYRGWLVPDES